MSILKRRLVKPVRSKMAIIRSSSVQVVPLDKLVQKVDSEIEAKEVHSFAGL